MDDVMMSTVTTDWCWLLWLQSKDDAGNITAAIHRTTADR